MSWSDPEQNFSGSPLVDQSRGVGWSVRGTLLCCGHADQPRAPEPFLARPAEAATQDSLALDLGCDRVRRSRRACQPLSLGDQERGSAPWQQVNDRILPIADLGMIHPGDFLILGRDGLHGRSPNGVSVGYIAKL